MDRCWRYILPWRGSSRSQCKILGGGTVNGKDRLSNNYYSEKLAQTIMSPGWLALFITSVYVLLQAGVVRSKQLEISKSDEVDYVSGDIFAIVQRCNWDIFIPHS